MSKSESAIRKIIYFIVSFVIIWPLIVFTTGPGLVNQLLQLTRDCGYYEAALYRSIYGLTDLDDYAVFIGKKRFLKRLGGNHTSAKLEQYIDKKKLLFIEVDSLKLPALAEIIAYLQVRKADTFYIESQPSIWTDIEPQDVKPQKYLDLLDEGFSSARFYALIRAVLDIGAHGCSESRRKKEIRNLYSASYILDIDSIYADSKHDIRNYAQANRIFWVYEDEFIFTSLKAEADTLAKLRALHSNADLSYGTFVEFAEIAN